MATTSIDNGTSAASPPVSVVTHGSVTHAAVPDGDVRRVIVAVHGVGDQSRYATIQAVVGQFCRHYGQPPATSLGSFHNATGTFIFPPPAPASALAHIAFAEVYWAKIPRDMAAEKHTLEEARQWAATIVERLRLRWRQTRAQTSAAADGPPKGVVQALRATAAAMTRRLLSGGVCRESDFPMVRQTLREIIESVTVLERLCFLADRAGLFTFDLRGLLDDYLGDVQVVVEFETEREKILAEFERVMTHVRKQYPAAEIHVIAHSEGTVVALLGLLRAFRLPAMPEWAGAVRGFMTIGSPLDKHLMLWPELFAGAPPSAEALATARLQWRNYYDRGDPVGFELDDLRRCLEKQNWTSILQFNEKDDIGFTRYPFPGKAHVDYWHDTAVFGHFIESVVKPDSPGKGCAPAPGDRRLSKWASYVLPYVGVALMMFIAVFIPFNNIVNYVGKEACYGILDIGGDVGGIAFLVCGVTLASRVPRLTRFRRWHVLACAGYAACTACGLRLIGVTDAGVTPCAFALEPWRAGVVALASLLLVVFSRACSAGRPEWGLKPLIAPGTLLYLYMAFDMVTGLTAHPDAKLWPVLLGMLAFAYLWWLAALVFDLVFIWHVHIRQSTVLRRLRVITGFPDPKQRPGGGHT